MAGHLNGHWRRAKMRIRQQLAHLSDWTIGIATWQLEASAELPEGPMWTFCFGTEGELHGPCLSASSSSYVPPTIRSRAGISTWVFWDGIGNAYKNRTDHAAI